MKQRKWLSVLLALHMIVSMLPLAASAADGQELPAICCMQGSHFFWRKTIAKKDEK